MGKFVPVLASFVQYTFGIYVFRRPDLEGSGPLFSCLIVLFGIFILLLELRLYPNSLRRLWGCGNYLVQYFIAVFLTEHMMADFWFPLEIAVLTLLPKTAQLITKFTELIGLDGKAEVITNLLTADVTGVFCSYLLSLFIFFTILHATKKIDLRILEFGIGCFLANVMKSLEESLRLACQIICNDSPPNKRGVSRKRGGTSVHVKGIEETTDDYEPEDYSPHYIK